MTINFRAATGITASADTSSPFANTAYTLPTGSTTNDLLIAFRGGKPYNTVPSTPTGYTLQSGGANGTTAMGAGTGSVYAAAYTKVHSGSESAPTQTNPASYSPAIRAMIALYSDGGGGSGWTVDSCKGSDSDSTGTTYSATGDATLSFTTGDWIVVSLVHNDDSSSDSAFAISVPGCTVGTVTQRLTGTLTTSTGNDGRMYVLTAPITAGTATGAPTVTATTGSGDSDGQSVFLLVREPTPLTTDVIYDNSTNSAEVNGSASFNHTPSAAPNGILVCISGEAVSGSNEGITAVTYGGVSMTKVTSGVLTGADSMFAQAWFLGSSIPTGTQSVAITGTTNYYYIATCYSMHTYLGGDTTVKDYAGGTVTGTSVSTSLTIPSGDDVFIAGALGSDAAAVTDVTDGGDLTRSHSNDHGSQVDIINQITANTYAGTGSAYTGFGWTISTSQANAYAVVAVGVDSGGSTIDGTASVTGAGSVSALARQQAGSTVAGVGSVTANASVQTSNGATIRGEGRIGGASGDDMIIPFYIYPTGGSAWDTIIADPKGIGYIIANDRSGNLAGQSADSNYTAYLAAAKAAGIKIMYYVDTNYGAVAEATVKANMDAWVSFYGQPDGWFFDRGSGSTSYLSYYQSLYAYGSGSGARKIVLNHGFPPDEQYLSTSGTCDISVIVENTAAVIHGYAYWPSWLANYSPDRYCVLAYNATNVRDTWGSIPPGIKYKYVADTNVWYALPTFYSTEVSLSSSEARATIQAGSTVQGTGSVTTNITIRATASVMGAGSVTAVGSGAIQGVASVVGTGSVTAAATQTLRSTASVTGVGSTSALARQQAGSSAAGVGAVTAAGSVRVPGTASVAGVGSVTATSSQIIRATASVTGSGSVTAIGGAAGSGAASVAGTGSVTALATQRAGSTVTGVGAVSATVVQRGQASVAGVGAVSATAKSIVFGTASVTGTGSVAAVVRQQAGSIVVGNGTVSSTVIQRATATVLGVGSVVASQGATGAATVMGAGSVTALATQKSFSSASGVGSVSNSGIIQRAGATVVGAGTVTATGEAKAFGTATVTGAGSVTAAASVVILGTASVQGVGAVTATGGIKIMGTASVIGMGSVTVGKVSMTIPTYTFRTPTTDRLIDPSRSPVMFRHLTHGVSVLRIGGDWIAMEQPSDIQVEAADRVYMGGRDHQVTAAQAAELTAAGYSITNGTETVPLPN